MKPLSCVHVQKSMKNHEVQRLQTLGQLKNENIDFYGSKTYAVDSKGNQTNVGKLRHSKLS